jgi:hypothetical protein
MEWESQLSGPKLGSRPKRSRASGPQHQLGQKATVAHGSGPVGPTCPARVMATPSPAGGSRSGAGQGWAQSEAGDTRNMRTWSTYTRSLRGWPTMSGRGATTFCSGVGSKQRERCLAQKLQGLFLHVDAEEGRAAGVGVKLPPLNPRQWQMTT